MSDSKLQAGSSFPEIIVPLVSGESTELGASSGAERWKLVIVYRGLHCPLCAKYLSQSEEMKGKFEDAATDIIAVSGDGLEKAKQQVEKGALTIPLAYDLAVDQMREIGLYISDPRSPEETDQPFPEPGLFVLRPDRSIQIIDISNAPFARPDLTDILRGLTFARDKNYPIRGTHQ
jgi:peroxiredoxin